MNKPSLWLLALCLGLLLICGKAAAQGQPIGNGIYACDGVAQAGPCQPEGDGDSSHSGGSSGGYTDNDYAHAEPKWADRWGAIAGDGNGTYGIVESQQNEGDAKAGAIAECKKRGGRACEVRLAYYNQCAAVASSTKVSLPYSGPSEEVAKAAAVKECNSEEGEGKCWIYYSGCSLPERIQ